MSKSMGRSSREPPSLAAGRAMRKRLPPPPAPQQTPPPTAVTAGDLAHQCQPESAAASALGGFGQAIEGLEDALALAGRHAGAAIDDLQYGAVRVGGDRYRDRSVAGVPLGVFQEIADQ